MRTRILVVLTLALAATAGALYLTLTSDHEENATFIAAVYLVVVWAFIGTGLVAWARRPGNKFGPLMVVVGFAFMLGALSESSNEFLFALGEILGGLGIAVFVHALLAFPRGYLETKLVYAIVGTAYFLVLGVQTIYNVFGATNCDGCPDNLLAVWDSQTARNVIGVVAVLGAGFVLFGTAAVLFRRWRAASPPLRRTLAPIFLTSAATLFFIGLAIAVSFVSTRASDIVWWFVVFSFALAPQLVNDTRGLLNGVRTIWFALAFISIGLETSLTGLVTTEEGRPAIAFLGGQAFNIAVTLILSYLLFGGLARVA